MDLFQNSRLIYYISFKFRLNLSERVLSEGKLDHINFIE
ncbi:hypothetical protein LMANV2_790004 [Leptospira interrogans serovar Manilae]|uniref:Uncharacterized protein n=1 Tax=Leptospira interrogans serovar Manilae TaxID=214675 RepID=A0AAQ1SQP8_LEPIR|nr:hypothetical protein LMANV2_790004 [Leptospira interrogans serovar Manilae]